MKSHTALKAVWAFFCFVIIRSELVYGFEASGKVFAENLIDYSGNAMSSLTGCGLADAFPCYNTVTAENPSNASIGNGDYSRLYASPGSLLGLGAYEGYIELGFDSELPANTTSYIKISGDENLLEALLGGSLGEVLSDVLGAVLLGNQTIEVSALNSSGTTVLSRDSDEGFSTSRARLVQDLSGEFYLMITPDQSYSRIRLLNTSSAIASLGSVFTLDVYHAFYYEENLCNYTPEFISYDGDGINLDALSLGSGGVEMPEQAIDGDVHSSASISPGLLNLGGSMSQFFYFSNLSSEGDEMKVTLSGDPSILNLELLSDISFVAYNGSDEVYQQNLGALSEELLGLIKLDVLGLLEDGERVTFPVSPGVSFDRFEIKVGSLVDVDVSEALNVHEVERTIGMPSFDIEGNKLSVCAGTEVTIAPASYTGSEVKWYESAEGGTSIGSGESYYLGAVNESQTYYVSSTDECNSNIVESSRVAVSVEALEVPEEEDFQADPEQANYGVGEKVVLAPNLESGTGIDDPQFVWSFNENGVPAITSSDIDKGDHTVSYLVRPDGALEIEGLLPDEGIDDVYLVLSNGEAECKASKLVDQVFRVLPINWWYFKGSEEKNGVGLKWSVSTDREVFRFIVQRAGKELNWKAIGEVLDEMSIGDSGDFSFMDFRPTNGSNYYRVQTVYAKGNVEYSKILRVDYSGKQFNNFSITPNPVFDKPKLHNNTGEVLQNVSILVVNNDGKEVFRTQVKLLEPWSFTVLENSPKLRPGVYTYCIYTNDTVEKVKIIW